MSKGVLQFVADHPPRNQSVSPLPYFTTLSPPIYCFTFDNKNQLTISFHFVEGSFASHYITATLKVDLCPPTNCVSFVLFSNEIMPAFFQTTHTFSKQNITIHLYTCPQLLECKTLLCEWRIFLRLLIQNYSIGHFKTMLIANPQHK